MTTPLQAEYESSLYDQYRRERLGGHGFASPQQPTDEPVFERPRSQLTDADYLALYAKAQQRAQADLGEQVLQGATANWADEAAGLVSPAMKADMRRQDAETGLGTKFVGQAIGGTMNPLLNLGFGGGLARAIGAGAGYGALTGAGAADRPEDMAGMAGGGALLGGLTAGAIRAPGAIRDFAREKAVSLLARAMGVPRYALRGVVTRAGESLADDAARLAADAAPEVPLPQVPYGAGEALPEAVPGVGPAVREPWPAGPVIREGFPRIRPGSPSEMVDALPPEFQTSRGTGGAPVPPRPAIRSPAELADAVAGGPGVAGQMGEIKMRPELAVPTSPGPYQRAEPASRMRSGPANLVTDALRLAGRQPELLADVPTDVLRNQMQLAQLLGGDPQAMQAVAAELAQREAGMVGALRNAAPDAPVAAPRTPPLTSKTSQMSDEALVSRYSDLLNRAQGDVQAAAVLDEIEPLLENANTGRSIGYQRAKELFGSAEDARRWQRVSEEAMGVLQDRGITPQDLRALYAARERASGAYQELNRLTAEAERRGLDLYGEMERSAVRSEAMQAPRAGTPMTGDVPFSPKGSMMMLGATVAPALIHQLRQAPDASAASLRNYIAP